MDVEKFESGQMSDIWELLCMEDNSPVLIQLKPNNDLSIFD